MMPSLVSRLVFAGFITCMLPACAGGKALAPVTAKGWVDRGDAALATDPGRALADYEKAYTTPTRSLEEGPAIAEKKREAAARWLRADVARWKERGDADPNLTLGYADAVRALAKNYGVEAAVAPSLADVEARALRVLYAKRKAELVGAAGSPLEDVVSWSVLDANVPSPLAEEKAEAQDEARRRRAAYVAGYAESVRAAGARRGAAFLRGRLLAMARTVPSEPEKTVAPAGLDDAVRIKWEARGSGCDGLGARALEGLSNRGAHRGTMNLELTCEVAAPRSSVYEEKERVMRRQTESKTSYEETCADRNYGGQAVCTYRDSNGNCASWSGGTRRECTTRPVTKEIVVEVPHTIVHKLDEWTVSARARGTLTIEVDGKRTSVPIDVTRAASRRAAKEGEHPSPPSNEQATLGVISGAVQDVVRTSARELEAVLLKELLGGAEAKLAKGDDDGAEDDLGIAIAAGASASAVPKVFAKFASRDGIAFEPWLGVVVDQRTPLHAPSWKSLTATSATVRSPELPSADREGLEHERAVRARDEAAGAKLVEFSQDDATRGTFGFGLTHWDTYGGSAGAGPLAALALRGGGGTGLPFYSFEAVGALEGTLGGGLGGGFDLLGRLGGGLRTRAVWLAPHVVVGASGRGTSDAAMYVPIGVDAGLGARLVVRVGDSSTLQLVAERISRPMHERGDLDRPVLQRMRYEARYVIRDEDETAVSASCSFHQRSAKDFVFPSNDILGRSCDASLFLTF